MGGLAETAAEVTPPTNNSSASAINRSTLACKLPIKSACTTPEVIVEAGSLAEHTAGGVVLPTVLMTLASMFEYKCSCFLRHPHTHIHTPFACISMQLHNKANTSQHSIMRHNTAQNRTAQHNTAWHSTAQYNTAWHSTSHHSTAQHSAALCRTTQNSSNIIALTFRNWTAAASVSFLLTIALPCSTPSIITRPLTDASAVSLCSAVEQQAGGLSSSTTSGCCMSDTNVLLLAMEPCMLPTLC